MVFSFFLIQLTHNLNTHALPLPLPLPLSKWKDFRVDNMCMNTSEFDLYPPLCSTTRPRSSFRVHTLHRRRLLKQAKDKARTREEMSTREMEIKNLKLYMENKCIIEENEKLRKKALLLHQENRVLLSQLQFLPPNNQQQNMSL